MLSARSLFRQIHADDETYRLFCSIAASGEAQGGWENARIAALVRDPDLAPKVGGMVPTRINTAVFFKPCCESVT